MRAAAVVLRARKSNLDARARYLAQREVNDHGCIEEVIRRPVRVRTPVRADNIRFRDTRRFWRNPDET